MKNNLDKETNKQVNIFCPKISAVGKCLRFLVDTKAKLFSFGCPKKIKQIKKNFPLTFVLPLMIMVLFSGE